MNWPILVRVAVLVGICGLGPLAFANPPDPLWIGGLFDAGDADDVIAAATSTEWALEGDALDITSTPLTPSDQVALVSAGIPSGWARATRHGRAPPAF